MINGTDSMPVAENSGDLSSGYERALPLNSSIENAGNVAQAAPALTVDCTTPEVRAFQTKTGREVRARGDDAMARHDMPSTDHSKCVSRAEFIAYKEEVDAYKEKVDRKMKRFEDNERKQKRVNENTEQRVREAENGVHELKQGYRRQCVREHNRKLKENEKRARNENSYDWCKWSEVLVNR